MNAPTAPVSAAGVRPEAAAIEARGVSKLFGSSLRALDDVSLAIRPNEFFTMLGPSGCGKTTLLRLFAGFEPPTTGAILLEGRDVSADPPNRRPVNTVFQSYALFPHLTVAENVAFGLEMLRRPKDEVLATVAAMLDLVKLAAMADRRTAQLSGGQQQRVALARALAPRPKVLLLDEPLSALDLKLRREMQTELKRLQLETGITFVFVTHDQEEALTMSDRIAVMSEGRVRQVGDPRAVYDRPADRFVAGFIGESNFLRAEVVGRTGTRAILRLAAGAMVEAESEAPPGAAVTVAVRPEQLEPAEAGAQGALSGALLDLVYAGADTHVRVALPSGETVTMRRPSGGCLAEAGATLTLAPRPGCLRVLRD
jgi:spermidine/putrescine transport system ATP-binding protein